MCKFSFVLINIVVLLAISSCVSIGTLSEKEHNNKVFSGTIRHIELGCSHGSCVDFPFSLVTDSILLPITIPWSIYNVSTGSAEKYIKSQEPTKGNIPKLIKRNNSE